MRHRVLGLEVVTADGAVINDLKRVIKANEGYDIKQLFIGAEGTLGVITRIALRLDPLQLPGATALVAADSATNAIAVYQRVRHAVGSRLRAAEVMWQDYMVTASAELKLPELSSIAEHPVGLILEIETDNEDDLTNLLADAIEAEEIVDAIIAKNDTERQAIWLMREDSWAIDRVYPHGLWFDVSVPLGSLDAYIKRITDQITTLDNALRVFTCGHLGDGNLHFTISRGTPAEDLYESVCHILFEGLHDIGGSFSAEHGIGLEKKSALATYGDPGKRAWMQAIKRTFDPQNIMNPGKVIDG